MKTTRQFLLTIIVSVFVFSNIAVAEPRKWEIDTAHSNIYFDIKHIFSTVRGMFNEFSGQVLFDPENLETSAVSFEVAVDSINTNIPKRDTHLRTDDFFSENKYPKMTFKSTHIKQVSENKYVITGEFTIKDVTKTIEVPFAYLGIRKNPLNPGETVAGFEADFTIDRFDFNVGTGKFYKIGAVGKDVHVLISLEVVRDL